MRRARVKPEGPLSSASLPTRLDSHASVRTERSLYSSTAIIRVRWTVYMSIDHLFARQHGEQKSARGWHSLLTALQSSGHMSLPMRVDVHTAEQRHMSRCDPAAR